VVKESVGRFEPSMWLTLRFFRSLVSGRQAADAAIAASDARPKDLAVRAATFCHG
jgi:hypothetical protein